MDFKELDGLEVFLAVVRTESFSHAARELGVSQPGVSRSIARLERRLGTRLFERTTRQMALTAEGRALHERLGPLLEAVADAMCQTREQVRVVRGRLRVSVDTVFPHLVSPEALKGFLTQHPELRVELLTRDHHADFRTDMVDVDVRFGEIPKGSFVVRRLGETRVLTVAAPSYIERVGMPKEPSVLTAGHHVMIDFNDPKTEQPFEWTFRRGRREILVPTSRRLIVNDVTIMHEMCLAGFGIAQVLEIAVQSHLASGRLIALFPDWRDERFPVFATYPSREHVPLRVQAFLAFVTQQVKRMADGPSASSSGRS